jgi:S-formylglutathione hydrolase FrmB
MRRRGLLMAAVTLCAVLAPVLPARADWPVPDGEHPFCHGNDNNWRTYTGQNARLRTETIGGRRVFVVLPVGYDANSRTRYPVVYLLPGGGTPPDDYLFDLGADIFSFTAAQPSNRQALVVLPTGEWANVWLDWRNGSIMDETLFTRTLIPLIDAKYRTIPTRAYRSIGGFSAGGFGALHLAARHPDLFAASGGFSAFTTLPDGSEYAVAAAVEAQDQDCRFRTGDPDPSAMWGGPTEATLWENNVDPVVLARNYSGVTVSTFSGNGVPCDPQADIEREQKFGSPPVESAARVLADAFDNALADAGVSHSNVQYDCGWHNYYYVFRSIKDWWGPMFEAFGKVAPSFFNYRRADPSFSVWDWSFGADRARATEFLDISHASASGIELSGSGVTTVTTARLFKPGHVLLLTGATTSRVRSDSSGRITFRVDLGAPHTLQQYSPAQMAVGAAPGYFTSRTVAFRPHEG